MLLTFHFPYFASGVGRKGETGGLTKCNYQNENNSKKTWQFNGKLLYLQRQMTICKTRR